MYWTHHWQKNITIPEIKTSGETQRWEDQDRFPEDDHHKRVEMDRHSDTSSSRDYPRLYLDSEYATEREGDFETDKEAHDRGRASRFDRDSGAYHGKDRH